MPASCNGGEILPLVEELVSRNASRGPPRSGTVDQMKAAAPTASSPMPAEGVDDGHGELHDGVVGVEDDQSRGGTLWRGTPSMPVRTIAAMVSGLILVNMPLMTSSSPPSSSGRIEIGTRAAVAPSGAPKYCRSPPPGHHSRFPPEPVFPAVRVVHTVHTARRVDPLRIVL